MRFRAKPSICISALETQGQLLGAKESENGGRKLAKKSMSESEGPWGQARVLQHHVQFQIVR